MPGLWQGGLHTVERCLLAVTDVDILVALAPDAEVDLVGRRRGTNDPYPHVIQYPLRDAKSDLQHLDVLHELAQQLAQAIENGKRVLIMCRMGWNRSGLLTSLVIYYLTGASGPEIINYIKSRRPKAMVNEHFNAYLKTLPPLR